MYIKLSAQEDSKNAVFIVTGGNVNLFRSGNLMKNDKQVIYRSGFLRAGYLLFFGAGGISLGSIALVTLSSTLRA